MANGAADEPEKAAGGGKRKRGAVRRKGAKKKTPVDLMRALVDPDALAKAAPAIIAGDQHDAINPAYVSPRDFCLAIINNDREVLKRLGLTGKTPSLTQRMEAARIAIPYTDKRMPTDVKVAGGLHSWMAEVQAAETRVVTMRRQNDGSYSDDSDPGS